jgi:hypothetical protein
MVNGVKFDRRLPPDVPSVFAACRALGISGSQLGQLLGVKPQLVFMMESGAASLPPLRAAAIIVFITMFADAQVGRYPPTSRAAKRARILRGGVRPLVRLALVELREQFEDGEIPAGVLEDGALLAERMMRSIEYAENIKRIEADLAAKDEEITALEDQIAAVERRTTARRESVQ